MYDYDRRPVRVQQPVVVRMERPPWKRRRCYKCGPGYCKCVRQHPYPQRITFEGAMVFAIFIVAVLMGYGLFGSGSPDGPETLQPALPGPLPTMTQGPTGRNQDKR